MTTEGQHTHFADAFTSFRIPATDRLERVNHGKSLRAGVPHEALGEWAATDDRPGVVDIIERSHEGRLDWLLGVRTARMAASSSIS